MNEVTTVSIDGRRFTEGWEGCVPHWYQDIVKVWTGGYGHTCPDASMRLLYPAPFGQGLMDSWLASDMGKCERALLALRLSLGQHSFDAICDAAFNCGTGLLAPANTITKRLLARDMPGAGDALLEWCHVRIDGKVLVNQGLLNRRKAERALLLTPDAPHLYLPDVTGYEVCSGDAICNPDELRRQGEALWLSDRPDYGHRELPTTD